MEVHAHTAGPGETRKKWTHYFWEFLMLFLAVFCGFLAEYQLEHKIEKDRESQFIHSLIEDLGQDTIQFQLNIVSLKKSMQRLDTLVRLLSSSDIKNHGSDVYYFGRVITRVVQVVIHDRTMQQLKNSGSFRLIRKEKSARKIIDYYSQLGFLERLEKIESEVMNEYKKLVAGIFHPILFDNTVSADNHVIRPAGNPALVTYDSKLLLNIGVLVDYIKSARAGLRDAQSDMNVAAKKLIVLLKSEYHQK
jgi:hypothetical protein